MNCPICLKEIIKEFNNTKYCSEKCKKEALKISKQLYYQKNKNDIKKKFQEKYPKVKEVYLNKKREKYLSNNEYRARAKERAKKNYYKNPERAKQIVNNYRIQNKDIINEKKKVWGEETGYHLKYYKKHADKKKAYHREYIKTNKGRFNTNFWNAGRRAMLKNVIHDFTKEQWDEKLKASDGICLICETYIGIPNLTMDHTYSLFQANKDYKETGIKRVYTIDDVQPICKGCNSSKRDKLLPSHKDDWRHKKMESKTKIEYLFEPEQSDKNKDTTFSSVWLFRGHKKIPIAEDPIHNIDSVNNLRGSYYSKFSPLIAESIINYWSNPGDLILDSFSGRTRAIVSSLKKRKYIGFEVSKNVAEIINGQIDKGIKNKELPTEFYPRLINDDCINLDKYNLPQVDFFFTCPPYFNLEKYESCSGQLSDINDYNIFLQELKNRLLKSCSLLKPEGYAAIVIGDFRRDNKFYILHKDILNIMESSDMYIHDIIILQTVTWDVAAYRFGSVKHSKKVSKVHEYLLIFKKTISARSVN
jgi:hypothetical protein